MLVGLPGSGKSFWTHDFLDKKLDGGWLNHVVLSTDAIVEYKARAFNSTYTEIWPTFIGEATKMMYEDLKEAVSRSANIIWDQTNLTASSRIKKLKQIPNNYRKIAVIFKTPDPEEHARRLASRPGKTIDNAIIENMVKTYETPSFEEGFDEIWYEHN